MRVLLCTGKGGVGTSTVAAATAAVAAARGRKALLLSAEPPGHLLPGAPAGGDEPVEVATGLLVHQVDDRRAMERGWPAARRRLAGEAADLLPAPVEPEELLPLPGGAELLTLLEAGRQAGSGRFDVVVVDAGPAGAAVRALALLEAAPWYLERAFALEPAAVRALAGVLSRAVGADTPGQLVLAAVERWRGGLAEARRLLTDPAVTSVRLVLTPHPAAVAAAVQAWTALSLHGYRVDGAVANQVLGGASRASFPAGWLAAEAEQLAAAEAALAPLPVRMAPATGPRGPVGAAQLADLGAALHGDADPLDPLGPEPGPAPDPLAVQRDGDGFTLVLSLPGATPDELELGRSGDDLVVTVGPHRRVLPLPSVLRRCAATGAALADGALRVSFRPDPDLWPRG